MKDLTPRFWISTQNNIQGAPHHIGSFMKFMKCRFDNFSMGFILFYVNLSICEKKKKIAMNMREQF